MIPVKNVYTYANLPKLTVKRAENFLNEVLFVYEGFLDTSDMIAYPSSLPNRCIWFCPRLGKTYQLTEEELICREAEVVLSDEGAARFGMPRFSHIAWRDLLEQADVEVRSSGVYDLYSGELLGVIKGHVR